MAKIVTTDAKEASTRRFRNILANSGDVMESGEIRDIKNLYVLINTVSFKSVTLAQQLPGRLRKLPDGTHPTYIELVDACLAPHMYHLYERAKVHRRLAYTYQERYIP